MAVMKDEQEWIKAGDHGPRIEALQRHLLSLGYPLPRYGADGWMGDETYRAAAACIQDNWPELAKYSKAESPDPHLRVSMANAIGGLPVPGVRSFVTDLTKLHTPTACYKERRKLRDITAIVLHQTAPGKARFMGSNPRRWLGLQAHIGITHPGEVFWVARFDLVMWHANWFNMFSVGIEIDGHFEGVLGNDKTLWSKAPRPPAKLTAEQVEAARRTVEWVCDEVAAAGGSVKNILAHRQTSESREADPGEAIWREVGLWAQDNLGLENDVNYTTSSGKPIPREWDPRSSHGY